MRFRPSRQRGSRLRALIVPLSATLMSAGVIFAPAPATAAPKQDAFYTSFEEGEPQALPNRQAAPPSNFTGQVFATESLHLSLIHI